MLIDLVKAFEMIKLELVWRAGLKLKFNPVVLRLFLESFSATRRLVINGACSGPANTLSYILAGGAFATDAMFMVLLGPCDQLLVEHPSTQLGMCLFVDDLTLDVPGTLKRKQPLS